LTDQLKVKKVKAYPIPGSLKQESGLVPIRIVKLVLQGFLAEVDVGYIQPGDRFQVGFELPVSHHLVSENIVIVKLYNQSRTTPVVVHLIEAHFTDLSTVNKVRVTEFLRATKQVR